jgi:HSP20 family protein
VTSQRDLFANFERMRRQMDELFGEAFEGRRLRGRGFSPRVDVYYTDNPPRAVVRVDLAAVDPADVALEIPTQDPGGRLYQQIEIEHGPFRRIVELGADVVADKATASYVDGVLQVEIPLAEPEKSVRRVPISEQ